MDDGLLKMKELISTYIEMSGIELEMSGEIIYEATDYAPYHPKKQWKILYKYNDTTTEIGMLAQLHPRVCESLKIDPKTQVIVAELFLETLSELYIWQEHNFQSESTYNTIQDQILVRDLSFVIDKDKPFGEIVDVVKNMEGVKGVNIFDLYQGEHLPEGKKSLAISLTLQGDGSWTSDQINTVLDDAVEAVKKIWWEVR